MIHQFSTKMILTNFLLNVGTSKTESTVDFNANRTASTILNFKIRYKLKKLIQQTNKNVEKIYETYQQILRNKEQRNIFKKTPRNQQLTIGTTIRIRKPKRNRIIPTLGPTC